MENKYIWMFALEYLRTHPVVSATALQRFILERPEVGKALPLVDIRAVLDESYSKGRLELVFANGSMALYKLPDYKRSR